MIILKTHLASVGKSQRVVRIVSFRVHTRRHDQMPLALTFEGFKRPRQVVKLKSRHTQVVPRLKQRVQDPAQTSEPKLLCSLLQERFL